MRVPMTILAVATCGLVASGCSTFNDYASACERDYARNREIAMAAVAGRENREEGAAIGAAAGALLGHQLSAEEDPCGYGFGGYNRDYRYGRERIYWRDGPRPW